MTHLILNQDVEKLDWDGEPFHAMLCDPPYHLTTITKRFGKEDSAPAQHGTDGLFARLSKGFMGQEWDGGDVAFRPETWHRLGEFLYPGAFGMAFAAARGWHRLAVAIEDAGFIIHPTIFLWTYSSGFPKASRIDTWVDKDAGAEREIVAENMPQFGVSKSRIRYGYRKNMVKNGNITRAATPLAKDWEGHRYGLGAIMPAAEPIILFQRPYEGRPIDNIVENGAGALNIEGARISMEVSDREQYIKKRQSFSGIAGKDHTQGWKNTSEVLSPKELIDNSRNGRWPKNLIIQHLPGCRIVGYKQASSYQINRFKDGAKPFGNGAGHDYNTSDMESALIPIWECEDDCPAKEIGENAELFMQVGWSYEQQESLAKESPVLYYSKAGIKEKNAGLSEKNPHPTVKPIDLIKYMAQMLLPPDRYAPRRILIPFSGVGSEMIGAKLAGWEDVVGIERSEQYANIAEQRINYWTETSLHGPDYHEPGEQTRLF